MGKRVILLEEIKIQMRFTKKKSIKTLVLNLYNQIDRRLIFFSMVFSLFIFLFERAVFKVNYRDFILGMNIYGTVAMIFTLFIVMLMLLCFAVFVYVALASLWKYRIIYWLIFSLAVIYEYGYQKAFGRFSEELDITLAIFTTANQKLNSITTYFNPLAIIPIAIFLFILIFVKPKAEPDRLKSFLLLNLFLITMFIFIWLATPSGGIVALPSVSFNAFARTGSRYLLSRIFSYDSIREEPESPLLPESYKPNNNIIFIVDESIRGDHLSLNGYSKPTTPFLEELAKQGVLKNWGIAASGTLCSYQSHDLLLTGIMPENIPVSDREVNKVPLIFQYAQKMGYKTYYLDGQMDKYWGVIGTNGFQYLDVWLGVSSFYQKSNLSYQIDFEIAKKVNEIMTSSSGNFIFIFKNGNHFPYSNNFPEEEALWKPYFKGSPYKVSDEELPTVSNAFDNGLRYNSENFFKTLAADYKNLPNNTIIVYTGDHGETLSEDGATLPHGGDSKKVATVPLFIIGKLPNEVDTNYKASHANIFPTILDLINYPEELRKREYALSLLKAKAANSKERYFVTCNLANANKLKFD